MVYTDADKAIHRLNRRNLKAFDRLKQLDEINLIREIADTYRQLREYAVSEYVALAIMAFTDALVQTGKTHGAALRMAKRHIDRDWVLDYLEDTDPVTMYQFMPETDRKAQRLTEAVAVPEKRQTEIERALRYWTLQSSQYAINIVDAARIEAFETAGIKRVVWNTENDSAVCNICDELDGRVFHITNVPPKQHYHCRCWLTPLKH